MITFDLSNANKMKATLSTIALLFSLAAFTQPLVLINQGANWKYLDDGSDQGTAWTQTSFDDSQWSFGPAKLGYGDPGNQTVVSFGNDPNNKYITTYFRHEFNVTSASTIDLLEMEILYDDGAVVYLNGVEVFRVGMPMGSINYLTQATGDIGGAMENQFTAFNVDGSYIQPGTNVIAVEIHQNNPSSSDIGFDFKATASQADLVDGAFAFYFPSSKQAYVDSITAVLNSKHRFYQKAQYSFSSTYRVRFCEDLAEFQSNAPGNLAAYEAGYFINDTIFIIEPITPEQQATVKSIVDVARHTLAKTVMYENFNGNIANWLLYGFARMETDLFPDTTDLRNQYNITGQIPTVNQMMTQSLPSGQDFYDFATTMTQFVTFKFGYREVNYISFQGSSVQFGYWSISSNQDFETVWESFTELFYLNDDVIRQQTPSQRFRFWATNADMQFYDDLVPAAEHALGHYTDSMDLEIEQRLNLVVYPTLCEYQASSMPWPCDPNSSSIGGGIGMAIFQMVSPGDINRPIEDMVWLMEHELAHVVQANIINQFLEAWLSEGYAMFMPTGSLIEEDITQMRNDLLNHLSSIETNLGYLPSKSELGDYGFVSQNNIDYYLIGQAMVDWIVKHWGYDGLKAFILSAGNDVGVFGFSNDAEFMAAFYGWVDDFWQKYLEVSVVNGNLPVYGDSVATVYWLAESLGDVSIEFSADSGHSWMLIADQVQGSNQSYIWDVPDTSSQECLIRMTSLENEFVWDIGEVFEIIEKPIDTTNGLFSINRGIDAIRLYPNPTSDWVKIENEGSVNYSLTIYNLNGQIIDQFTDMPNGKSIDLSRDEAGVYIFEFDSEGVVSYKRVVRR